MGEVILEMKGIDKSFPGVHALDHVDLEIRKGEVLALMGENGAGKSTLMKVLTGIYTKDSGTITYEGKEVEFHSAREAQDNGVIIVHQELNMLGHLTVAQNIFIGREFKKGIKIDDKKMNEEAQKLFDRMNVDIDPRETMSKLTVGKQQMCEIAKAISTSDELLDETIDGNAQRVAELIEQAHDTYTSVLKYNDENSLSCVLTMAYFTAPGYYNIVREMPAGKGFADFVFIPRANAGVRPAMVVELKYNKSADTAIKQIKENRYHGALSGYSDKILLVGISYDAEGKDKKHHTCVIEEVQGTDNE